MKKSFFAKAVKHFKSHTKRDILMIVGALACLFVGGMILWISSFRLPDLSSFEQRKVSESTKIYDRTGQVLLFDLHDTVRRTVVADDAISPFIKKATVAIEDEDFYQHHGIKITSIIRAVFANIFSGGYSQGGSTITQQVVKNTLLTSDKTISRKLKEWVLAVKLDKALPKDRILEIYLNENPYGGNMYGVEEASKSFFGVSAKDVTLAEAAYLAAIPQASTYFSPYGDNRVALEDRKNLVLRQMLKLGSITQAEYDGALAEKVEFEPQSQYGIKAPHFVFFVKAYLESLLGDGALDNDGYKVITTLNADFQAKAEALVKATALSNEENFNAENASLVAIDPTNGDILGMVGSRDYFDKDIDGKYNVAVSGRRQPGSTMKPIIYSEAFIKGYTPETVLFDLPTEFNPSCAVDATGSTTSKGSTCYHPQNYDGLFRGPISLRNALAQSINVPSVETFYLAGTRDALSLAKDMGISTLGNADQYGLTLVLGSGEVSLLEMTSAYGTFADDGTHVPYRGVIQVLDSKGNEVKLPAQKRSQVLPANVARSISSILSDNTARTPAYGPNSVLYFPTRDVAVKTGTTNDSKDAWTIGYTPNLVVGVWAGNNNGSAMVKKVAGQIVAPLWSAAMKEGLALVPDQRFITPSQPDPTTLKPVLKGFWQGGEGYTVDRVSGKLATDSTPADAREDRVVQSVHSILYWLDKNDPLGPKPTDPSSDGQFEHWETSVRSWALSHGYVDQSDSIIPTATDDVHTDSNSLQIRLQNIDSNTTYARNADLSISVSASGKYPLTQASLYINGALIERINSAPFIFRLSPEDIPNVRAVNSVRVSGTDSAFNSADATVDLHVEVGG